MSFDELDKRLSGVSHSHGNHEVKWETNVKRCARFVRSESGKWWQSHPWRNNYPPPLSLPPQRTLWGQDGSPRPAVQLSHPLHFSPVLTSLLHFFGPLSHLAISVISASVICSDMGVCMLVCASVCLNARGADKDVCVCVCAGLGECAPVWWGIKRSSNRSAARAIDSQSP